MFTGFNLIIDDDKFLHNSDFYNKGISKYEDFKSKAKSNLEQIINKEIIDGDELQNMWFPSKCMGDSNFVFISHSHNDEELAIRLAGYLYEKFGILSFIDSCIWDHMDDLNKMLNECGQVKYGECDYCNCDAFSRNLSYVHMMLASALMTMIDKCECIFFLNTASSINRNSKTESPWIYYELNIAGVIDKKNHRRVILEGAMEYRVDCICKSIEFTPNLNKMKKINQDILKKWEEEYALGLYDSYDPYDVLYKICGGIK